MRAAIEELRITDDCPAKEAGGKLIEDMFKGVYVPYPEEAARSIFNTMLDAYLK